MVEKRWELCGAQKRKKVWREVRGEVLVAKTAIREGKRGVE